MSPSLACIYIMTTPLSPVCQAALQILTFMTCYLNTKPSNLRFAIFEERRCWRLNSNATCQIRPGRGNTSRKQSNSRPGWTSPNSWKFSFVASVTSSNEDCCWDHYLLKIAEISDFWYWERKLKWWMVQCTSTSGTRQCTALYVLLMHHLSCSSWIKLFTGIFWTFSQLLRFRLWYFSSKHQIFKSHKICEGSNSIVVVNTSLSFGY